MRKTSLLLVIALLSSSTLAFTQTGTKPAPTTKKPAPTTTKKPAPTTKPAAPAAKPVPPPPPPPSDIRFKSKYQTGDQVTQSVTYVSGARERYDLGSMILLRQHDLKRSVQISLDAKTYLIVPAAEGAAPAPSGTGVVIVETTINDVGERKTMFGHEARRVATVLDRKPQPGACDQLKQRVETVGWYIDAPKTMAAQPPAPLPPAAGSCHDEVKVLRTGDEALVGFPLSYTTTLPGTDDKPVVMQMEVTEFEVTRLDAALFEIPSGMTEVTSGKDLAKAVSDANEVKLAATPADTAPPKKAGVVRVAVPELLNKTTQDVDARALRTQLIAELIEQKVDAMPLAAAPQADLDAQAKALGADYLLIAQITELKASKPGGLGRLVRRTAGESTEKDVTEAKLNVQLVPVGATKPKMSTTTDGKDGGMGFKTGLRLARAAAMMYLRYASPLSSMNSMAMMNMGGMSALGNPGLMQMQSASVIGTGRGLDRTAGAAMFMMDAIATGSSAGMAGGPSFDASLAEAIEGAAKKTRENVNR
jgi:hypothetical protein